MVVNDCCCSRLRRLGVKGFLAGSDINRVEVRV